MQDGPEGANCVLGERDCAEIPKGWPLLWETLSLPCGDIRQPETRP